MEPLHILVWAFALCGAIVSTAITALIVVSAIAGIRRNLKNQRNTRRIQAAINHPSYGKLRAVPKPSEN